jgi:hypothetical protein
MDRPAWHVVAAPEGAGLPWGGPAAGRRLCWMKLVILERDGTINHEGDPFITSPEDWAPLPGALDAIALS